MTRIVFLGDISVAGSQSYAFEGIEFLSGADYVIANLEGPILTEAEIDLIKQHKLRVLYNSPAIFDILKKCGVDAVSLANNHIFDYSDSLIHTKELLSKSEMGYFGAGRDLAEAHQPLLIRRPEGDIRIYGFGWDVIGCQYPTDDKPGVNPLEPEHLLQTIRELRGRDSRSVVVFYLHWNYELEKYPQPADRQLARKLIDEGVDVIIGLHPHLPGGAELYRGKPIIYSLGNWFFPPRKFGAVSLDFSPEPSPQIAVEIALSREGSVKTIFHWVCFDQQAKSLRYTGSEDWDGKLLAELTPFSGLSERDYLSWFKRNRKKRYSLPIYRDYSKQMENWAKDQYVKLRQRMIWLLVKLHLKK